MEKVDPLCCLDPWPLPPLFPGRDTSSKPGARLTQKEAGTYTEHAPAPSLTSTRIFPPGKQVLKKRWLALGRKENKTMRTLSPPTAQPMPPVCN